MKLRHPVNLIFVFLFTCSCYAQLKDLARIDYTYLPASDSNIEITRLRALFNYPFKLKKEGTYIIAGLDYSVIHLFMQNNPSFIKDALDDFQILDLNIAYTTPLKNDWRLGIRFTPGFSSNLTANELGIDDLVLSGTIVFINNKKNNPHVSKPWSLVLGVTYAANRGFPFPLPFISYYRKFHPKWSYNIGIPKSNLQYHFSAKHRLKATAELDGFTSNLQNGVLIDGTEVAETINLSLILSGLQYEYHMSKHLELYARSSYVSNSTLALKDNKKEVKRLDSSNDYYLRFGGRFKF